MPIPKQESQSSFFTLRGLSLSVAAIIDDATIDQADNDRSTIFIQKSGYVIDGKPMIDEQIADSQSPFDVGIEVRGVVRQGEWALAYEKALTSMPHHSSLELQKTSYQSPSGRAGKGR